MSLSVESRPWHFPENTQERCATVNYVFFIHLYQFHNLEIDQLFGFQIYFFYSNRLHGVRSTFHMEPAKYERRGQITRQTN